MSSVVGIDLSSFAVDLVRLDEDSNRAEWLRVDLHGARAWDRLLALREAMPPASWWDDVYLVAVEAPHGRGEAGTQAKLNQVAGAVACLLPAALRAPERCWLVRPDEWKRGLGLTGKPTGEDLTRLAPGRTILIGEPHQDWQNGLDAYALALWARDTNARAVEKAISA